MKFRQGLLLLALCAPPLASAVADDDDGGAMERGRELTQAFYDGDTATVWAAFDEQMKNTLGSEQQLAAFRDQIKNRFGAEVAVDDEQVTEQQGYEVYLRTVRFEKSGELKFHVQWAFDEQGGVAGFYVRPAGKPEAAPSAHLDYQTRANLHLPFQGRWYVFWGGRGIEQNYHAASPGQRFAYDFLVVHGGKSHSGVGTENADYYCWRRQVLAPAGGEVVVARDGLPDNVPGKMDAGHPPGNYVVIDHGHGEYSFLAHMKQGSITVATGDRVSTGQTLGLCGNSGNTSEPHLHFHLQTTPDFDAGEGLPAQFQDYLADGKPVSRGEPVKSQTVSPQDDN